MPRGTPPLLAQFPLPRQRRLDAHHEPRRGVLERPGRRICGGCSRCAITSQPIGALLDQWM